MPVLYWKYCIEKNIQIRHFIPRKSKIRWSRWLLWQNLEVVSHYFSGNFRKYEGGSIGTWLFGGISSFLIEKIYNPTLSVELLSLQSEFLDFCVSSQIIKRYRDTDNKRGFKRRFHRWNLMSFRLALAVNLVTENRHGWFNMEKVAKKG